MSDEKKIDPFGIYEIIEKSAKQVMEQVELFKNYPVVDTITAKVASNIPVPQHFNQLTPAQAERLAILGEELGEVQQVIGKILRHGFNSYHPDNKDVTNREMLTKELGDVEAAIDLLVIAHDLDDDAIGEYKRIKLEKIKQWVHHQ